jgi:hypothetical protein
MISLFRKYTRPGRVQLAVLTGILTSASFVALPSLAQAQEATRTQLSTEHNDGVLSLSAKVMDLQGQPVSDGSVSFETAKGSLGSAFVHNGWATLNLTNAPSWARSVTAVYHGADSYAASAASASVVPDATSGVPGFTVTASPSSVTLTAGQYGTVQLTITSQNGFSEAVNLSCSGLPGASNCNFTPVVATPAANATANSSLQITTTARSGAGTTGNRGSEPLGGSHAAYAVVIPGVLALVGIGAIRRRNFGGLRILGLALLLAAGSIGLTACNQRYSYLHYKPSPNFGTGPGNYTIVIAAYASNGTAVTQATSSDGSCAGATCIALTVQ